MVGDDQRADWLDRFWDVEVQGQPQNVSIGDEDLAATVRALHRDVDAPSPAAAFVQRLEASLIGSEATPDMLPMPSAEHHAQSWLIREVPTHVGRGAKPHRRWSGIVATAAALILVILGGAVVYRFAAPPIGDPPSTAMPFAAASTPAGEPLGPEDCTVAPRDEEEFVAFVRQVLFEAEVMERREPLRGVPVRTDASADSRVVAEVTRTAREMVACLNTLDILRVYALWTDDGLRRTILTTNDPERRAEEMIEGALRRTEPVPLPPDQRQRFAGVADVVELSTGRVRALVALGSPDGTFLTMTMYFVVRDGRYLIDSEFIMLEEPYPIATP